MTGAPEVRRSTSEFRRWTTWVGSLSELERVQNLMQKLAQQRSDAELAQLPLLDPPDPDSKDWLKKREYEERAEKRAELERRYIVETRLTTGNQTIEGIFQDIAAEFDYRTFTKLELYLPIHYSVTDKMTVVYQPRRNALGSKPISGVSLWLESKSIGWEKQAMAQISEELDAGRPSWAWLTTWWGTSLSCFFVAASFGLLASAISAKSGHTSSGSLIGMITYGAVLLFALFSGWPLGSLFPPVEIHREGVQPKSTRAIAFIFSVIVVPILISVALNLW